MIVTTSWDDGNTNDLRLAELMKKYGIRGTFYVPQRNSEGRSVLSQGDVRMLGQEFEIAAHTKDHVYLDAVTAADVREQLETGKSYLEQILGSEVRGFCYPGGRYNKNIKLLVERAGYSYARTAVNLCCSEFSDFYEMPTTIQFYPRLGIRYARSYFRYGQLLKRFSCFWAALLGQGLTDTMKRVVDACRREGTYLHIWGHSWEIADGDHWRQLEELFQHIRGNFADEELFDNLGAINQMRLKVKEKNQNHSLS